jgi:hypothetical protein
VPEFLKFTDEDGDPIYCKNDIIGIFTKCEKTTIGNMLTENLRTVKANECRGIISQSTGQWSVRETYEEILAEIDRVTACGSSE